MVPPLTSVLYIEVIVPSATSCVEKMDVVGDVPLAEEPV